MWANEMLSPYPHSGCEDRVTHVLTCNVPLRMDGIHTNPRSADEVFAGTVLFRCGYCQSRKISKATTFAKPCGIAHAQSKTSSRGQKMVRIVLVVLP